jgi:branched-chain amino acid transport system permease protein
VRGAVAVAVAAAALLALDAALPQLLNPYYMTILSRIGVAALAAASLQLVNGFTGQFSIGHAGFMAVGAYVSAALSVYAGASWLAALAGSLPLPLARTLYFPLPLIAGGLAAAVAGLVVGIPALRLRGDYLAIATLGFGEIIRIAILNVDAVGGARGFSLASPAHPALDLRYESFGATYGVAILSILVIARLVYATATAFRAVREDETAAESVGIATTRVKVEASWCRASRASRAHCSRTAKATCTPTASVPALVRDRRVRRTWGPGSITGAVLAAAVLTAAPEVLRGLGEWRMILYSVLLIAMMLVRPEGLMGRRELVPAWLRSRTGGPRAAA